MKDKHIIEILESVSFTSLSDGERTTIVRHTAECATCAKAYRVAMVSADLLRERIDETHEPPPFFHTRVLAALREQQTEVPALQRMWRAAGALVSSMAAAVVLLAVLSFLVPGSQATDSAVTSAYSVEQVILQAEGAQDEASDAQVLTAIYDADDDSR